MQLQQRHSTTDFLELAQSSAPIQPSADHPRQNPSGKSGLFIDGLLNAFENIWAKFLTAGLHTGSLEDRQPLCPAKNVGHVQLKKGGGENFCLDILSHRITGGVGTVGPPNPRPGWRPSPAGRSCWPPLAGPSNTPDRPSFTSPRCMLPRRI